MRRQPAAARACRQLPRAQLTREETPTGEEEGFVQHSILVFQHLYFQFQHPVSKF